MATAEAKTEGLMLKDETTPLDPIDCYDTIILIKVGPEKQEFHIHRGLLMKHSEYFKTALNSGFKEAIERVFELPEDDAAVFGVFYEWLYTRKLPTTDPNEDALLCCHEDFIPTDPTIRPTFRHLLFTKFLVGVWILGDVRRIPSLQNVVMHAIVHAMNADRIVLVPSVATIVYSNTMPRSPLRTVARDLLLISTSHVLRIIKSRDYDSE